MTAAAFALVVNTATLPQAARATTGTGSPQGDTWDSIKLLPDFKGPWTSSDIIGRPGSPPLPLTPNGKKKFDAVAAIRAKGGDIEGRAKYCIYLGFPGDMTGPEAIHEFLYVPGRVIMDDVQGFARMIYTDGRRHHIGPPTFWGDSIGHWEGKTLVVDTIGMQHNNEMAYGFQGGKEMHVIERMYLKPDDPNTMIIETTIEAPEVFTKPYHMVAHYKRHPDWLMTEWDCAQDNRDLNAHGGQQMNLTLPPDHPTILPHIPDRTLGSRQING